MNNREYISFLSGLVGVIIGTLAQYVISYHFIEKPKIQLENQKVAIEAQRQVLSQVPMIESQCENTRIDNWTWQVICKSKNKGLYPVMVGISNVSMHLAFDQKAKLYEGGNGFAVDYPNQKKSFMATANTPGGDLQFFMRFDKKHYPSRIDGNQVVVRVSFSYKTIESVANYISKNFPEAKDMLNDLSNTGSVVFSQLKNKE